jgi:hypothetical protein
MIQIKTDLTQYISLHLHLLLYSSKDKNLNGTQVAQIRRRLTNYLSVLISIICVL